MTEVHDDVVALSYEFAYDLGVCEAHPAVGFGVAHMEELDGFYKVVGELGVEIVLDGEALPVAHFGEGVGEVAAHYIAAVFEHPFKEEGES